jgi:hypothetical protein
VSVRLSFEEVKKFFSARGYILLETEYKNARTKMRYECPSHKEIHLSITYGSLKAGAGCPYCANTAKYTLNEIDVMFRERGYKLLEKVYKNRTQKLLFECPIHKEKETKITLKNLLSGSGCAYCAKRGTVNIQDIKEEFEARGYELLENKYINNSTRMRYTCKIHPEKVRYINYNSFSNGGNGCSQCAGNEKITIEEAKKTYHSNGYILLSKEILNTKEKLSYRCPTHGVQYASYDTMKRGVGCPKCKSSKGEKKISRILSEKKLKYNQECRLKECRYKYTLPFDFIIESLLIIEYDGEGHFEPFRFSKDKSLMLKKLMNVQTRDKIKNQYCIDNNISLIRIPYWEFKNIEYILENVLRHYNLIESDSSYDEDIVLKYLVDENWDHDEYISMGNKSKKEITK